MPPMIHSLLSPTPPHLNLTQSVLLLNFTSCTVLSPLPWSLVVCCLWCFSGCLACLNHHYHSLLPHTHLYNNKGSRHPRISIHPHGGRHRDQHNEYSSETQGDFGVYEKTSAVCEVPKSWKGRKGLGYEAERDGKGGTAEMTLEKGWAVKQKGMEIEEKMRWRQEKRMWDWEVMWEKRMDLAETEGGQGLRRKNGRQGTAV